MYLQMNIYQSKSTWAIGLLLLTLIASIPFGAHSTSPAAAKNYAVQPRGDLMLTKNFSCTRSWGPKGDRQRKRLRVRFYGWASAKRLRVGELTYAFTNRRGSVKLGDKNNINIYRRGQALWSSPDSLKSGRRYLLKESFNLPRRKKLHLQGIFDIFGSDPSCQTAFRLP